MKRILYVFSAVIALLVIAALVVPMLIPTAVYRSQIEQAASEALGVEVKVSGDPQLSILPRIAARVDGLTIANPEGYASDTLLNVGQAQANVALLPLLSQKIEIKELVFRDVDLKIEQDAEGVINVQRLIPESSDDESSFLTTVDRARFVNANVSVEQAVTGNMAISLQGFDGWASYKGLDQPIESRGEGTLNGYAFDYRVRVEDIEQFDGFIDGAAGLDTALETDFFRIAYDGTLDSDGTNYMALVAGDFEFSSDRTDVLAALLGDALPAAAVDVKSIRLSGTIDQNVTGPFEDFFVDLSTFTATTDYAEIEYQGRIGGGQNVAGAFAIDVTEPSRALRRLPVELPINAEALQRVTASGDITAQGAGYVLDLEGANVRSSGATIDYVGSLDLSNLAMPVLDGSVDVSLDRADQLLTLPGNLSALLRLLDQVEFKANVSGPATAPRLTNIQLRQRGPDLTTDYSGDFALSGDAPIDGTLNLRSDNPRVVFETLGLPISASSAPERLSLTGNTTGTSQAPSLSAMELTLDDTTATGEIGADLGGRRPRIVANLSTNSLDLTPFLGTSESTDREPSLNEDWDDTPLQLDALNLVDATLTVAAQEVVLDQIVLNDAKLNSRLDNGRLSAIFRQDDDAPGFKVFQGNWSGDLVLDASRSTPTLQVEALADSIAAQEMLTALTGFQNLSGIGGVALNLTSEGNSLKALINGLDGRFESDLNQGALKGMNLAKLVRDASNLRELVASGNLTLTSFRDAFSPEAETDFSKFIGNLTFTNGVASITDLSIDNPVVGIVGAGQIDLGARTLDIRLTPQVDLAAAGAGSTIGVGSIPVPVRVSGSWSSVQFGLDSSAVQTELANRFRNQATNALLDQIGGDTGNILGEIVGTPDTSSEAGTEDTAQSIEDALTERALGALFGTRETDEDETDN